MNIFLINHYAGSPKMGMEFRPYYFAKEWINSGHNVTIIAADFSHLRNSNPITETDFTEENIEGINYLWVKTPKYEGNGIGRIKNMFSFIYKSLKKAKYLSEKYKPDVVIASSTYPSDNYLANKIAKYSKAKYIYEVHDLWPLSPMEIGGMSKFHPFIMLMQHGENFAYKNANAIISMLPNTKQHMKNHGLDLSKWHYLPNGIKIGDINSKEKIPNEHYLLFKDLKQKNKKIILYAGGHALSNSLKTFIEVAHILKNDNRFAFVLVGNGSEKQNLIEQANGLDNVSFLGAVSKNAVQNLLSYANFLYIGWNKSKLYRFGISPNKIFDYMIAEKPIIHATDAPNNFVDEAKCGIATEPENPNKIAKIIIKLQETPKEELEQMGKNGHEFVLKNHDYKVLANKFIEIIENI